MTDSVSPPFAYDADCTLCNSESMRPRAIFYLENELCVFFNLEDLEGDLLRGSGVVILLAQARPLLDERYKPDGFNIGWNVYAAGGGGPHAHMHVLLRFADEPKAGQGIRWPLRQADNRRPDPIAPGGGSRVFLEFPSRAARTTG